MIENPIPSLAAAHTSTSARRRARRPLPASRFVTAEWYWPARARRARRPSSRVLSTGAPSRALSAKWRHSARYDSGSRRHGARPERPREGRVPFAPNPRPGAPNPQERSMRGPDQTRRTRYSEATGRRARRRPRSRESRRHLGRILRRRGAPVLQPRGDRCLRVMAPLGRLDARPRQPRCRAGTARDPGGARPARSGPRRRGPADGATPARRFAREALRSRSVRTSLGRANQPSSRARQVART